MVSLPTFSDPSPLPDENPLPGLHLLDDAAGPDGPTLTATSSTRRDPSRDELLHAAKLVKGLTSVLLTVVDLGLGRIKGRRLRKPDAGQLDDFSAPVAGILTRHVDIGVFGPDVADATEAAAVIGDWLGDGPVTYPKPDTVRQVGLPDHDPAADEPAWVDNTQWGQPDEPAPVTYLA